MGTVIMKNYAVAAIKTWNIENFNSFVRSRPADENWVLISNPEELNVVIELKPDYVFFVHWSWRIPREIFENINCIGFHMTDLPFGRGGSPLQNLIKLGHSETRVSAFEITEAMDAGDIYLKADLSLRGSAQEIYERASALSFQMITEILVSKPTPQPQEGTITTFQRRTPDQSEIASDTNLQNNLQQLYDHIRMLDAEGYPKAFLNVGNLRLEFSQARMNDHSIQAQVEIIREEKDV